MTSQTMKLSTLERERVQNRAWRHWKEQKCKYSTTQEWKDYWKTNKRQFFYNARLFKGMLNAGNFQRYLTDYETNPWTLWNIQTMNG